MYFIQGMYCTYVQIKFCTIQEKSAFINTLHDNHRTDNFISARYDAGPMNPKKSFQFSSNNDVIGKGLQVASIVYKLKAGSAWNDGNHCELVFQTVDVRLEGIKYIAR